MGYKTYSQLSEPLSLDAMKVLIVDLNPFTELYNCGDLDKFENKEEILNALIKYKHLETKARKII